MSGDGTPQVAPGPAGSLPCSGRATLPVTVVVATIGRVELVGACVESVLACDPGPAEVVVVDQSGGPEVADRLARCADPRVRVVPCAGTGISRAANMGLRRAGHDVVMMTDDDCTVATDWIAAGWKAHAATGGIASGRVLPAGDPKLVPSTITLTEPRDWTGIRTKGSLYRGNMVGEARAMLALGGFDERATLRRAAEDNDFCYRWAKAGLPLHFAPEMVVWHHDWRSPEQLGATYRTYATGQGAFYAKHLATGDLFVLRFVVTDLRDGLQARLRRWRAGDRDAPPTRRERLVPWLFVGLVDGWREARRIARAGSRPAA